MGSFRKWGTVTLPVTGVYNIYPPCYVTGCYGCYRNSYATRGLAMATLHNIMGCYAKCYGLGVTVVQYFYTRYIVMALFIARSFGGYNVMSINKTG